MIDYLSRLEKIRARMAEYNIGLLMLMPGANLFYATGIRRQDPPRTDTMVNGDWAMGAYVFADDLVIVSPPPGVVGGYVQAEAQGKPWITDIRTVYATDDPYQIVQGILARPGLRDKRVAIDDRAYAQTALNLRQIVPGYEIVLVSEIMAPLRMIKEEVELELMQQAGVLTGNAFEKAVARLQAGVTELDIATEIDYQLRTLGAEFNSFVTTVRFVGIGKDRPATAGRATRQALSPGDSIWFDFGCVYEGYCSDFGRSAFLGEPPPKYMIIHETVLQAQQEAMKAMVGGKISAAQLDGIGRSVIEKAGFGQYFTHNLGHGIGISVHEFPKLSPNEESILQNGTTLTLEPSIRIPDTYYNRIEDVFVVTPEGGRTLYNIERKLYIV